MDVVDVVVVAVVSVLKKSLTDLENQVSEFLDILYERGRCRSAHISWARTYTSDRYVELETVLCRLAILAISEKMTGHFCERDASLVVSRQFDVSHTSPTI